jgi:hypothetical protein
MNIIIIIIILMFLLLRKENFNNPKKIISKKKIIENYIKEFNCDNFVFHDSHEVYNFSKNEIYILLKPIFKKINNNLSTNFIVFEILKAKKYLGGYYHVIFSAVDNSYVSNFEIKFNYENKKIRIGLFNLLNSEKNNILGYDQKELNIKNKINSNPDYSWMFDLARGDMGLIPHTGNNQN